MCRGFLLLARRGCLSSLGSSLASLQRHRQIAKKQALGTPENLISIAASG
jgi:hypothetical protein